MKKWNFHKPLLRALIIGGTLSLPFVLNAYYQEEYQSYGQWPSHLTGDPNQYPVTNAYPYSENAYPVNYGNQAYSGNAYPVNYGNQAYSENAYPVNYGNQAYSENAYPVSYGNQAYSEGPMYEDNSLPSPMGRGYPYINELPPAYEYPVFSGKNQVRLSECESPEYPVLMNEENVLYEGFVLDEEGLTADVNQFQRPISEIRPLEYQNYPLNYDSCAPCPILACVKFGGEFIYWKPLLDDLDFAFISNGPMTNLGNSEATGSGRFKYVHFDWEPGFRLYVKAYGLAFGWNILSSYTCIHPTNTNSIDTIDDADDSILLPTAIHGGYSEIDDLNSASARWDIKYKQFDVLFGYDFQNCDCHIISPFIGVDVLRLDHKVDIDYESTISNGFGRVDWDGDFVGVGLKAGANYHFDFTPHFYFDAKASASIVTGDADYKYRVRRHINGTDPERTDLRLDSNECLFIPGFHIGLSLGFNGSCYCYPMQIEIGYEFVEWDNTPNPKKFWEDFVRLGIGGSSSLATLGFHGFKAGMSLSF